MSKLVEEERNVDQDIEILLGAVYVKIEKRKLVDSHIA